MPFRMRRDADLEVGYALQARDQFCGIGVAVRMGNEMALTFRRVAPQRHDVMDTRLPVALGDGADLGPARANAGEVGGGTQSQAALDGDHGVMGALAGGTPGAVGDGDEARRQGSETFQGLPQLLLHLGRAWREELERHSRYRREGATVPGCGERVHVPLRLRMPSGFSMPGKRKTCSAGAVRGRELEQVPTGHPALAAFIERPQAESQIGAMC